MAAAFVEKWAVPIGQSKVLCEIRVTMDSAYVAGGEAIDGAGDGFLTAATAISSGGYVGLLIPSTQKVKAFQADYDAGADGPLVEVPGTPDLSAVVFTFLTTRAT